MSPEDKSNEGERKRQKKKSSRKKNRRNEEKDRVVLGKVDRTEGDCDKTNGLLKYSVIFVVFSLSFTLLRFFLVGKIFFFFHSLSPLELELGPLPMPTLTGNY